MTREFYEELGELIKKHNLTLVTGPNDNLGVFSKKFEGKMFFITDGTPNKSLQGCEKMMFESSHTIRLTKKINNYGN
jgi:hypothetical protein